MSPFDTRILLWRWLYALLLVMLMAAPHALRAAEDPAVRLQEIGALLDAVDQRLAAPALDDEGLSSVRDTVSPLAEELRRLIEDETPRRNAIEARLKQFGDAPPPGATPESPEITSERLAQSQILAELQDRLKLAVLLRDRADTALRSVIDQRRARFTSQLLAPSQSVLSPALWIDAARGLPQQLTDLVRTTSFWRTTIGNTIGVAELVTLIVGLLLLVATYRPFRRFVHGYERRDPAIATPSRLQKAVGALKVIIGGTLAPALVIALGFILISELGFLPGRLSGIAERIERGLIFIVYVRAVGWAVIPVEKPGWRFFAVTDDQARQLQNLMLAIAVVISVGGIVDELNRAVFAGLSVTVAARGLVAVLVGLLILDLLRRVRNDTAPLSARLRLALFGAAVVILAAAAFGYVALSSFAIDQLVWISSLLILVSLLLVVVNEFLGRELSASGKLGGHAAQVIGMRGNVVDQFGVLLTGAMRVAIFVFAVFLALAPWGVDGADLFGTLRAVFFGFTLGGVTISLSTVAVAITVFVIGFLITRTAQRWLGESYLPHTSLDQGLRNSISTSFGYIGIIVAAVIALSQAGFSLDRLAIVAGALSVGIGFGLQSVVNNFVSGLILLWERPLKVGDWLEIGQEHGVVKNIRVRSTEIETFDKASLIVPNSEFISKQVKNWVHSGRTIRLLISIPAALDCEPKLVESILLESALEHIEVLSEPKPRVFFRKIGTETMEFDLVVFVDADAINAIRSDLLFAIAERFRQNNLTFAPKPAAPA